MDIMYIDESGDTIPLYQKDQVMHTGRIFPDKTKKGLRFFS